MNQGVASEQKAPFVRYTARHFLATIFTPCQFFRNHELTNILHAPVCESLSWAPGRIILHLQGNHAPEFSLPIKRNILSPCLCLPPHLGRRTVCPGAMTAEYGSPSSLASSIYQQTSPASAAASTTHPTGFDATLGLADQGNTSPSAITDIVLWFVIICTGMGDVLAIAMLCKSWNRVSVHFERDLRCEC